MATNTKNTKTKAKPKVEKPLSRRELAKKIDKNGEVLVMNNTMGGFYYKCDKTHEVIDLSKKGDTQIISVDTLLFMKNTSMGIFDKYWLLVIDVLDDEFTVEELFAYMGFDKYAEYMLDMEESLKDIINNNYTTFVKIIENLDVNILSRMAEYCVAGYEEGTFTDYNKMQAVEKAIGRQGVFDNIDVKKEIEAEKKNK